ncbi:MFS transporter [Dictyobacter aurantiacus]|uniref:MFS transporter n=1 Tax=Dictyobacter aurantiacus TaxID=1936993 RepID=A0A401ZQN5_9CHLR|nr:MFS transporter [Dictyobacter aurantiacus]GCE09185.1 MFS transporter [Dictyobacter aurantiacus]
MFVVLRNRNYALLWLGGLISTLGDWVLRGALPFYVYAHTGSALATGMAFIASTLPWIVLSSVAGVFVDRWNRKWTMIVADLARAMLLLLLLLVLYAPNLFWLVYVVSFTEACITQFFNPASLAFIPSIVGRNHLQKANALSSLSSSSARLLGPLLGGALLEIFGLGSTTLADSISYLCSAVLIALVLVAPNSEAEQVEASGGTVRAKWFAYWRDWLEGLRTVGQQKGIRTLFVAVGLGSLADGVINALFVLFPSAILGMEAAQYGAMLTALGIGSLLGSVCVGWLAKRLSLPRLFWLGWAGKGLIYLLAFNVRSFPLILALFTLSGVPTVSNQVSTQTLLQTSVEDRLRARVFGAYVATLSLLLLVGTGLGSILAVPLGILPLLDLGCAFFLLASLAALLLFIPSLALESGQSQETREHSTLPDHAGQHD